MRDRKLRGDITLRYGEVDLCRGPKTQKEVKRKKRKEKKENKRKKRKEGRGDVDT